ncbi:MAG: hypothetical protein ABFC38_13815 [Methanospirillum sp.]
MKIGEYNKDILCPHLTFGNGDLICTIVGPDLHRATSQTTREICKNCDVGRIIREIGCDQFDAQTHHIINYNGTGALQPRITCRIKYKGTTYEQCSICDIATAETALEVFSETAGLLHFHGFESARHDFEKARQALHACEYDAVIRSSIAMLESTMKIVHDRLKRPHFRNSLSDAHGDGDDAPEVPATLAEFIFLTSCSLATLIVRRYVHIAKSNQ